MLFTASARDTMLHAEGDHPLMWTQPAVFRYQADFFLESIEN